MSKSLNILYVSSEVYPYAKSGGLGDVSAALPRALRRLGHDVRILLPKFKSVEKTARSLTRTGLQLKIPIGTKTVPGKLFEDKVEDGPPVYFLGNDYYYRRDGLYGENGKDYPDNAERFIFFCRAALETCRALDFRPDIIHCSDWQAGLVPVYRKTLYADDKFFTGTRTVFSIHNLGYQGNFWHWDIPLAHLPWSVFTPEGVEFYNHFNFLKAGIVYADVLTTVSKTYSREILTPEMGFGMDGILRTREQDLYGIPNGVDYTVWNPRNDPRIPAHYDADHPRGKSKCKKHLISELKLKLPRKTPLLCMITRLSSQKGIDLVIEAFPDILNMGAGFVLLGSGDGEAETFFRKQAKMYPDRFACILGFDEDLAHRILAGSDILLMPSRYEPCGLTQLYAMHYGTVPVAHKVGGLADTVQPFNIQTGRGTGFVFRPAELKYFLKSIKRAMSLYQQPLVWKQLVHNGMTRDFSWEQSAKRYIQVYKKALLKQEPEAYAPSV